jgi:CHAT domain-containing protein
MAVSRPSPASNPESLRSGKWWNAKDFVSIRASAAQRRAAGDLAGLEAVCQTGLDLAKRLGSRPAQIAYLTTIGNSRLQRFQYASALEAYLAASHLAEASQDWEDFGAISGNLSSVYQQVGDLPSALSAAERGQAALRNLPQHIFYEAQLLLQLGRLHSQLGDGEAARFFLAGIDAAREQDDQTLEHHAWDVVAEAQAWDLLGMERLSEGRLAEAEAALSEALRLRALFEPKELVFSYWHLGRLRLAQARLKEAANLTQSSIRALESTGYGPPLYVLLNQRGRIREAFSQTEAALEDLRAAVETAQQWRLEVPPAGSSLTAANVELDAEAFSSYVDATARQALRTGSPRLRGEGFLALEMNRAASLRETKALAEVWHRKLPPVFWETLGKFRAIRARQVGAGGPEDAETKRLDLELTEMEAVAGLGYSHNISESFRSESSLIHFQKGLGDSELLLSFHLGEQESYLWAVTDNRLSLYRLPAKERVQSDVAAFRDAVVGDHADAEGLGARLYLNLFGQLTPQESGKKSWLLSMDGSLFDLPFAALILGRADGKAVHLVEKHSVQMLPGALLLSRAAEKPPSRYVAVADPIYNLADSRSAPASPRGPPRAWARENRGQLNRLVASGLEVEASRRSWGNGEVRVLEGTTARKSAFLQALSPVPSVIHLATHVLTHPSHRDQSFLAFSLGPDARPELLGTADVAMLQVPGSVVVMTGCATASGEVLAGAGLLGLTRAWMVAGADSVVATGWPVADSRGDLLPVFYSYLTGSSPAEALRRSQVDMLASGTWQASPAYWAAFQVTGGVR